MNHKLRMPHQGEAAVAGSGSALIYLDRGWVADQPQRYDWCFAYIRAPENLKSGRYSRSNVVMDSLAKSLATLRQQAGV